MHQFGLARNKLSIPNPVNHFKNVKVPWWKPVAGPGKVAPLELPSGQVLPGGGSQWYQGWSIPQ
jgi:hypothetical protein